MITADEPCFPNNVVDLFALRASYIDADMQVFKRPLRTSDPLQCIGIFGSIWEPSRETTEVLGKSNRGPTLDQYGITVQAFVKHMDEEQGLAIHSVLSERVRSILYRDEAFRVTLQGLTATVEGVTKRAKRWEVRQQRYFSNEIQGDWLYLSTLEFRVETEIV